jgi:ribonuclease PH
MRIDGRKPAELRKVELLPNYVEYPEGSILITQGNTRILCNVTIEQGVPNWMKSNNIPGGWVTAEYSLLPRATHQRTPRESHGLGGRTQEIRRLIGRSLRAAIDLEKLGPHTCIVDCDVIQADGSTRTVAVTGGFAALSIALKKMINQGNIRNGVITTQIAATSVGILGGQPLLDLCYEEDVAAEVDANIVMTSQGEYVELQATAEKCPFSHQKMEELLVLAKEGITQLMELQRTAIEAGLR